MEVFIDSFAYFLRHIHLEEVSEDFSSQMLSTGFLVIHDTAASGQHDVSKM